MAKADKPHDTVICHTRKISEVLFVCLEDPSRSRTCGYSFEFDLRFYCAHPDRSKFDDHSKDNQGL